MECSGDKIQYRPFLCSDANKSDIQYTDKATKQTMSLVKLHSNPSGCLHYTIHRYLHTQHLLCQGMLNSAYINSGVFWVERERQNTSVLMNVPSDGHGQFLELMEDRNTVECILNWMDNPGIRAVVSQACSTTTGPLPVHTE